MEAVLLAEVYSWVPSSLSWSPLLPPVLILSVNDHSETAQQPLLASPAFPGRHVIHANLSLDGREGADRYKRITRSLCRSWEHLVSGQRSPVPDYLYALRECLSAMILTETVETRFSGGVDIQSPSVQTMQRRPPLSFPTGCICRESETGWQPPPVSASEKAQRNDKKDRRICCGVSRLIKVKQSLGRRDKLKRTICRVHRLRFWLSSEKLKRRSVNYGMK